MKNRTKRSLLSVLIKRMVTLVLAGALTLAFFLVLPLIQTISESLSPTMDIRSADTVAAPPPPDFAEPEPPPQEEPDQEPPPPEVAPETPMAPPTLEIPGPGGGGGYIPGFKPKVNTKIGDGGGLGSLKAFSQLDQPARVRYQANPNRPPSLKGQEGRVTIVFIVDEQGRVVSPKAKKILGSPLFERPALDAIKRWRFDPATRSGEPVKSWKRVTIVFPKA